jgi:hypothetical protein
LIVSNGFVKGPAIIGKANGLNKIPERTSI